MDRNVWETGPESPATAWGDTGHDAEQDAEHGVGHGVEAVLPGARFDPWRYREDINVSGVDLIGYKVEATDGGIGRVDSWTYEVSSSHLVATTGPWIFGHKALIPAGIIHHMDHDNHRIYLDRTKDQIRSAPDFDPRTHTSEAYREKIATYYADTYAVPGPTGGVFPPGAVPPNSAIPPPP